MCPILYLDAIVVKVRTDVGSRTGPSTSLWARDCPQKVSFRSGLWLALSIVIRPYREALAACLRPGPPHRERRIQVWGESMG